MKNLSKAGLFLLVTVVSVSAFSPVFATTAWSEAMQGKEKRLEALVAEYEQKIAALEEKHESFWDKIKAWSGRAKDRIKKLQEKSTREELKEELRAHLPEFKKIRDEIGESAKKAGGETKEHYNDFKDAIGKLVDDVEEILKD